MHLSMFYVHLFRSEETRRNCVVCMLKVLLLLVGCQEGPAEQTRRLFVGGLVVVLDVSDKLLELLRLTMYVAKLFSWSLLCHK